MHACKQLQLGPTALEVYTALRLRMHGRPTTGTARMLLQVTLQHDLRSPGCDARLLLGPAATPPSAPTGLFQKAATRLAALGDATTLDEGSVGAMLPHARSLWEVHAMLAWLRLPGGWFEATGDLHDASSDWDALAARSRAVQASHEEDDGPGALALMELPEDGQAWKEALAQQFLQRWWQRDEDATDDDEGSNERHVEPPRGRRASALQAVEREVALLGLMRPSAQEAVVRGQDLLAARMLCKGIGT